MTGAMGGVFSQLTSVMAESCCGRGVRAVGCVFMIVLVRWREVLPGGGELVLAFS